tara:strand:- start:1362 stop:3374 length:2013 start_codon:yes stop_codon:yes gene_type:complete
VKTKNLKVLFIDPTFDHNGISNPSIPLAIGLIGSYLKSKLPEVEVKIMKLASSIIKYLEREKPDVIAITNYLWNTNLANRISRFAREKNPEILLIFGGPEISPNTLDKEVFRKKYSHADLLVQHEGEVAFTKIIQTYLKLGRDKKKLREHIDTLGNCFYVDSSGKFINGPNLSRIEEGIDSIPSPYVIGLFDEFLFDNRFQPLIQTNRGCPYQCTFCHEGNSYFSKIDRHSTEYIQKELNYIADRVDPSVGLQIVDSNFGMYREDIQTAKYLRHLQDTKKWPMEIESNTGKSQLPRIIEVTKILNGALMINNSTQSMNDNVLKIIKRKNLRDLMNFVETIDAVQQPEFILPLPGETKETFITGLNKMLDTGKLIRLQVHPTMLLNNTEMYNRKTVKDYNLKTVYRQHWNLMGHLAGEFICETEEIVISTSTMKAEEVLSCRVYSVVLESLLRTQPLWEIFKYLETKKIKKSEYMSSFTNLIPQFPAIHEYLEEYKRALEEENFDSEEEVVQFMEKFSKEYISGEKGGDNLKYSMGLWIEHFDSMIDLVFATLKSLFPLSDKDIAEEIQTLESYLRCIYHGRGNTKIKKNETIKCEVNFDLLNWSMTKNLSSLENFRRPTTYSFRRTPLSEIDKIKIWNSFGFYRGKNFSGLPGNSSRLYLSKLRRNVEVS